MSGTGGPEASLSSRLACEDMEASELDLRENSFRISIVPRDKATKALQPREQLCDLRTAK